MIIWEDIPDLELVRIIRKFDYVGDWIHLEGNAYDEWMKRKAQEELERRDKIWQKKKKQT